jgi:16S rRNA (cytidine1402-2'-O)-methyltransferase
MAQLYVIATPIGNLEDISYRAVRILGEVDYILAEDTRISKKLLERYSIKKPMLAWHQHSDSKSWQTIKRLLQDGKNCAFITDAGTPGVSDPGNVLVAHVTNELLDVNIIPIPGPSALTALLSVAGIATDRFLFLGFIPHKKGRSTFFQRIADSDLPVVFFESVHRIAKTLESLKVIPKQLIVGRELTKRHEIIYRGTATNILKQMKKDHYKGEFIILVQT